jgi:spore maturation protein CgeB
MKRSKIVLNSSIKNKEGAHERIFSGLACGALVATMDNAFMREEFVDDKEILLFRHSRIDELNERVSGFLEDESKRAEAAAAGRKKVMANHTWDNRAQTMLATIPRYFDSLSQIAKKNQC